MKPSKLVRKINCIEINTSTPSPEKYKMKSLFEEKRKGYTFAKDDPMEIVNKSLITKKPVPGPGAYVPKVASRNLRPSFSFTRVY